MTIKVETHLRKLNAITAKLRGDPWAAGNFRDSLDKIMQGERTNLVTRTKRGVSVDEVAFTNNTYSPAYKKWKGTLAKERRKKKYKSLKMSQRYKGIALDHTVDHVNLTLTGDMLKSLQGFARKVSTGLWEGVIAMDPAHEDKMKKNKKWGRDFFGFSEKMLKRIITKLHRDLFSNG